MNLTPDPRYRPRPEFVEAMIAAAIEFEAEIDAGWERAEAEWLLPAA